MTLVVLNIPGRPAVSVLQLDLDNEENEGNKNGCQGLYVLGKPEPKKAVTAESDSDLDLEYKPLVKR